MGKGAVPTGSKTKLFRDHGASDSIASISGWVGLLVIGFSVNDERSSSVAEEGMAVASEIYVFVFPLEVSFAVCADREVWIVPPWWPSGFSSPCFLPSGLKCGPADIKSGASHFAF